MDFSVSEEYEITRMANGKFLPEGIFRANLHLPGGLRITLHLRRTNNVNVDAPVFSSKNGKIVQMKLPKMNVSLITGSLQVCIS